MCDCNLCKRNREYIKHLKTVKNKEAKRYFYKMLNYIQCLELDLNVTECKLRGEWPNNNELKRQQ